MDKKIKREFIKMFYDDLISFCLNKIDIDFSLPELKKEELEKIDICLEKNLQAFTTVFQNYSDLKLL